MATVEINENNFESVAKQGIVLVDWWAEWCGPCRMFAPVFEAASTRHVDVVFGKVDTETNQELAGAFGIAAIPTLMVFRDGILLFEQAGVLPADALDELIGKIRELDMDEVRGELAQAMAEAEAAENAAGGPGDADAEAPQKKLIIAP